MEHRHPFTACVAVAIAAVAAGVVSPAAVAQIIVPAQHYEPISGLCSGWDWDQIAQNGDPISCVMGGVRASWGHPTDHEEWCFENDVVCTNANTGKQSVSSCITATQSEVESRCSLQPGPPAIEDQAPIPRIACADRCESSEPQQDDTGASCYCDAACSSHDDCCPDYLAACGIDSGAMPPA